MPHDVFISYATPDKKAADAVCASLEQKGIRCCIFPRDGIPGKSFAETITEFMASCKVVVLMLSSHANASKHISREVEMAVRRGLTVIPFRIENVQPSGSLEYWIAEAHWLDAITPEMERGLEKLAEWVLPHVSVVKRPVGPAADPVRDLRELYRAALNVAWADGRLEGERSASPPHVLPQVRHPLTARSEILPAVRHGSPVLEEEPRVLQRLRQDHPRRLGVLPSNAARRSPCARGVTE